MHTQGRKVTVLRGGLRELKEWGDLSLVTTKTKCINENKALRCLRRQVQKRAKERLRNRADDHKVC